MAGFNLIEVLIFLALVVALVWSVIDVIRNPRLNENERLLWILLILFVPLLGPVLYIVKKRGSRVGSPERPRPESRNPLTPGPSPQGEGGELS